jgi:predicted RNase H-like HicB family nuclease
MPFTPVKPAYLTTDPYLLSGAYGGELAAGMQVYPLLGSRPEATRAKLTVESANLFHAHAKNEAGQWWLLERDSLGWLRIGRNEQAPQPEDFKLRELTPPLKYKPYYAVHLYPARDIPGEWIAVILDWDVVTQGSSCQEALDSALEAFGMVREDDLSHDGLPRQRADATEWIEEVDAQRLGHGFVLLTAEGRVSHVLSWPPHQEAQRLKLLTWVLEAKEAIKDNQALKGLLEKCPSV